MASFSDAMSRTNSSQAMSSLFSAYADDDADDDAKNASHNSSILQKENSPQSIVGQISGSDDENSKSGIMLNVPT